MKEKLQKKVDEFIEKLMKKSELTMEEFEVLNRRLTEIKCEEKQRVWDEKFEKQMDRLLKGGEEEKNELRM